MNQPWQFLALRTSFQLTLPGEPAPLLDALAREVRPRQWTWSITLPPFGEFLTGEVDDHRFSVGCVQCRHVRDRVQLRWVMAHGSIQGDENGSTAVVVVRHGLDKTILNGLLLGLALLFLAGWPILLAAGDLGPVLAAGCATPALVLPALWLLLNYAWWREVQAGRQQMMRVLNSLSACDNHGESQVSIGSDA